MPKNVLLTNSYFYKLDKKQWEIGQPYPPLGTLIVASVLKENELSFDFLDNCLENDASTTIEKIENNDYKYLIIYDDGFNYLTKMCLTSMREEAYKIIKAAKTHGLKVIVNSSDSTDHFEAYHAIGADYIIHGEGEVTLMELIDHIDKGLSVSSILGISYLLNGELVKNLKRSVLKDLDVLPIAYWDLIDYNAYRNIWEKNNGFVSLNLATTRGCPYKCNWCAKPIYGNRYNTRSPKNVIKEISLLIEKYDVRYFWMCDDIFGLKPGWVQEFNTLKKEAGLSFQYKIQSRADLMLTDDNLDALVESGIDIVWLGAESGSQRILDAMDKGTKVEQIYEATRKLKSRGAKTAFFLQFGYLTETWNEIQMTIRMVLDLMPDDIGISVSYPLPGTKFYDRVKSDLILKTNWTDSDDLDLMFENTYPPIFYKILHRYVHNRYRIKKGWLRMKGIISQPTSGLLKDLLRMIYHAPFAIYHHLLLNKYANSK